MGVSHARPEAVTFDLDGTLVRYRRSPGAVLAEAFERAGVPPAWSVEAYRSRFDEYAARTDSMRELRRECFAALARDADLPPAAGRAVAAAFAASRDHENVAPLPGARDALTALAADGVRVGVVTTGAPDAQRAKLRGAGLRDAVDAVVVAGADCPPKPAPEPFERALAALDAAPSRAVHVGDAPADVAGAAAAGLDAVLVGDDSPADATPTWRVDAPGEVPGVLGLD